MKFPLNNSLIFGILLNVLFLASCGIPEPTTVLESPKELNKTDPNIIGFLMPDVTNIQGYYIYYKFYNTNDTTTLDNQILLLDPLNDDDSSADIPPGETKLKSMNFYKCNNNKDFDNTYVIPHTPDSEFTIQMNTDPSIDEKLLFFVDDIPVEFIKDGTTETLKLLRYCTDDNSSDENAFLTFDNFKYNEDDDFTTSDNETDNDLEKLYSSNPPAISSDIIIAFAVYAFNIEEIQPVKSLPVFFGYIDQFNLGDSYSDNDER